METLLIILVVLAGLLTLTAIGLFALEIKNAIDERKSWECDCCCDCDDEKCECECECECDEKCECEAEEPKKETAVALDSENAVTFESTAKLTLEEKYATLDEKSKAYYDEIIAYAESKEGVRCFKNARYVEYKSGKNRLVRLNIKRGVVIGEFILPNNDFKNYVSGNKLSIKLPTTVIKVTSDLMMQAVKESIDVAYKVILDEKEQKRLANLEKRRLARQNKD